MIKQLMIILLVCCSTNRILSQNLNNNIYDHKGISERTKKILNYNNGFLVLSGIKAEQHVPPAGILIRHIDKNGELLWTDFYKDETDSLNYYVDGDALIVGDSILYVFGSAQDINLDITPTFFKYNLRQKETIDFKLYKSEFGGIFLDAHLHNDDFFYVGGIIMKDINHREYNILFVKINSYGETVWQKEYEYGNREDVTEIESYGKDLLAVGRTILDGDRGSTVHISKIDTSGQVLNFKQLFEFGSLGITEIEVFNNDIFFTTNSEEELVNEATTYLSKMDGNFEIIWDTLIASSSRYKLWTESFNIINNEIIIAGNINRTEQYTNNKLWGYATSWSLAGELNWEQRFIYDASFDHYIDDVVGLPNGDLLFMANLFGFFEENNFNQNLWLFRTDSQGCGTVQDTCYYTLDAYFGLDTMVSVIEPELLNVDLVNVLGNPFSEQLVVQSNNNQLFEISIHNIQGKTVYEGVLKGGLSLNTANWSSGVYVMQVLNDGQLLGLEKLVRE